MAEYSGFPQGEWPPPVVHYDIPQQLPRAEECGIFVCYYAKQLIAGRKIGHVQPENFRREIANFIFQKAKLN